MKNLKIIYLNLIVAGCWVGSAAGLQVFNRGGDEKQVTTFDDKGNKLGTISVPAQKKIALPLSQSLKELQLIIDWGEQKTAQKQPQQTTIEHYDTATGWITTGSDENGNPILVRLVPPTTKESIPKNATVTYKKIGDLIVRVDTFPANFKNAFTHKQTLQEALYAQIIQPNSYIIISQIQPDTVSVKLFHPLVIKAAVLKKRK